MPPESNDSTSANGTKMNRSLLLLTCFLGFIASVIRLTSTEIAPTRRVLQEVPVTSEEVDIRLEVYDELFRPGPDLRIVRENQKEVRIRQDCVEQDDKELAISNHQDSRYIQVSCKTVHYRARSSSLENIDENVVIGVVSRASNIKQRKSIRETWASGTSNVFFIVAGPWDDIKQEYSEYRDLIWVDQEEVFISATSGVIFKTSAFLYSMHEQVMQANPHIQHFFKTEDDVYINLHELYNVLENERKGSEPLDYWGTCYDDLRPHRWKGSESFMTFMTYPFAFYPPYCIGIGYVISTKFLDCAVGGNHLARVRHMPYEDIAVGMLAERCGISFPNINDKRNHFHWDQNKPATMTGKILQHNVKTPEHMKDHHHAILDPI